jgi:two-component system CheB/CheR fusion protein
MATAAIKASESYVERLRRDDTGVGQLSGELLIKVTSFFRDAAVFEFLANELIPGPVREHHLDRPIRIWIASRGRCVAGRRTPT